MGERPVPRHMQLRGGTRHIQVGPAGRRARDHKLRACVAFTQCYVIPRSDDFALY
ncbi:hypothetical protein PCL1606_59780 [Pseudomonas chlororaphis]|uniref:Uncharacterized protein n=1 Tax=Pseudomonas chlororaphis TaxID=587753 RepID=A0A0D5Y8P2_9PSED|nr:hypothetical protein PCL1606_59780 [Pseudomonas chlororaphis]